jgi:hypothetical protein
MKKIIFTLLIGLMSASFVQAQLDQGTKYLGGNFNLGFGSSSNKVGSETTDGPKTFNFGITPTLGFFMQDNLMLGLGIGYSSSSMTTKGDGVTEPDEQKVSTGMFDISPFVRYYMMPTEKMGFFVNAGFGVGFGKMKDEVTMGGTTTTDEMKLSAFSVGVTPGVVFFISEKVAFEATFGGLIYSSSKATYTINDTDFEDKTSDFGLEINPANFTFGVAIHIP